MSFVCAALTGCGETSAPPARDEARSVPPAPGPAVPAPTRVTVARPVRVSEASPDPGPTQAVFASSGPSSVLPAAETNLIENGSFEKWAPRERVPWPWKHGFGYPAVDEMPSSVQLRREGAQDGAYALEQTWRRSDAADSVFARFGITVDGLKPRTAYRFTVRAKNESNGTVVVSPYSVKEGDGKEVVENLKLGLVEVKPGDGYQNLKGYFQTGDEGSVRLAAACIDGEYPVTVVWDDWRLVELGPAE